MSLSINTILKIIRPKHYVKNLFIFLPLFFSGKIFDFELMAKSIIAFVSFSFAASTIYILNDIQDIEHDRLHPRKKLRPIAAGAISQRNAIVLMFFLLALSLGIAYFNSVKSLYIILVYIFLNIAYSYVLKYISLVDITIIAIGFVLRIYMGSIVTGVPLSKWIVIMTFLLSLFLALAKRRDDVLIFNKTGEKMRKVISGYNLMLIDGAMLIMSSVVIVSYILYTTSDEVVHRFNNDNIYISSLFVILGILRYMQITMVNEESGAPVKIAITDRFLQINILCWFLFFLGIIYS